MTLQEMKIALANVRKGRMVKVHYQTIKGDYKKETKTIVRFVEYSHIKGVVVKGKPNPNENHVIPNMVVYNAKNGEYYLQMATIKTKYHQVSYSYQGQAITKQQYETANPSKPFNTPIFKKNIKDIISIG